MWNIWKQEIYLIVFVIIDVGCLLRVLRFMRALCVTMFIAFDVFVWPKSIYDVDAFFPFSAGGVRQKIAEHMPKICSRCHLVPTYNFFPKLHFFSSKFLGPTNFFPKMQIFSSEILGPTHISIENSNLLQIFLDRMT